MVFCFLAITKIQLFIEKLLFLPHYFGVGNFSYLRVNNSVLAAKYALMSTEYKDSDLVEVRNGQLHEMQSMYDYNRNKDLAIVAKQKAEERQFVMAQGEMSVDGNIPS